MNSVRYLFHSFKSLLHAPLMSNRSLDFIAQPSGNTLYNEKQVTNVEPVLTSSGHGRI